MNHRWPAGWLRSAERALAVAATAGAVFIAQPSAGAQADTVALPGMAARSAPSSRATAITVTGKRPGAVFAGIGAISGGGGNSRYLINYPVLQQKRILDYLFKPHFGASLQMLKLEIGGGSNSSDGSEPSVEPVAGQINCNAGYEWWEAEQAVARNPQIKLYGLQWGSPGWTRDSTGNLWTQQDINYLIDWLNCAKAHHLTISYLGGRNEAGYRRAWYEDLRAALDANGYGSVQIVASDGNGSTRWNVAKALAADPAFNRAVSIVGVHDPCGLGEYKCLSTATARSLNKPLWVSEQGELDPNAQAANEARVINRMYLSGGMTAMFEWPLLNAMPSGLPYENRGLVTADQPWSGSYQVNKQTWATAQTTQFTYPGWKYVRRADKMLGNSGSVVGYMSPSGRNWSLVAENTGWFHGQTVMPQRVNVTIAGGLKAKTVRVWSTNLTSMSPSAWFVKRAIIHPRHGRFHFTIQPGYVVTFTATTGQRKGGRALSVPAPGVLPLPYSDPLNGVSDNDGSDEPAYLASLDGAFEFGPCAMPGSATCLQQVVPQTPALWHSDNLDYPYAVIGDPTWSDYTVSVQAQMHSQTDSAGVIGRFTERASRAITPAVGNRIGLFEGYLLDVAEDGTWQILKNTVTSKVPTVLKSGSVPALGTASPHTLALGMQGSSITAYIDGRRVGAATDSAYSAGLAGIEAGAFTGTWPADQFRNFSVTPLLP